MIVCHRHRFIFLRTQKTASTSLEIALSRFCDEGDIVTSLAPEDEKLRRASGGRGPFNHLVPWSRHLNRLGILHLLRERRRRPVFRGHGAAKAIRDGLPAEVWSGYFKFCFERNPWDKVVSHYHYRARRGPLPPIDDFVAAGEAIKCSGWKNYAIDDRVVVDRVCRYENLAGEVAWLTERLGLPETPALGTAKSDFRKDRRSYREVLSDESRERIARDFRREIALLDYEF